MVMYAKKSPEAGRNGRHNGYGQGGPVFMPARELSAQAREILARPLDGERVTAYDEIWYLGRPQEA